MFANISPFIIFTFLMIQSCLLSVHNAKNKNEFFFFFKSEKLYLYSSVNAFCCTKCHMYNVSHPKTDPLPSNVHTNDDGTYIVQTMNKTGHCCMISGDSVFAASHTHEQICMSV